jgi:hydrocephalus-inducing protein
LAEVQARCAFAADGGRTFKKLPVPETAVSVETGETGTDQSTNDQRSDRVFETLVPAFKSLTYKITFTPKVRSAPFQVPFAISVAGAPPTAVSLLTGACVGAEVSFARRTMDFGAVVDGARVTKTTRLRNEGDVGCSFAFESIGSGSGSGISSRNFEVFPMSGYVGPGADQEIQVTFRSSFRKLETSDIPQNGASSPTGGSLFDFVARCALDGGADTPLELAVSARCVTASAPTDTVRFSARARGAATATAVVANPTDSAWRLRPSITNTNWRGAETLFVPANGEATYTITFAPLAVSTEEDPHVGTVRFELPDGSVDTRALVGVADAAERAGAVEATVPAKKTAVVAIDVKNWLARRQRFKATCVFGDGGDGREERKGLDETVTMRGQSEFLEVAGNQTRPYRLTFYGFRANETTRATVSFENADTGDVAAYDVSVTTVDPEILETIPLRTAVRQRVVTQIPITNPTSVPVDVTVRCSNPRTFATRAKTTLPPRGAAAVGIAYAPVAAETNAASDVLIESDALGTWPYALKLSATAAGPERGVSFTVPLGSAETKKVTFRHFLEEPATFAARWRGGGNGGAFVSAEKHDAPGATTLDERNEGLEQHIDVTFEPTSIGSQFRDVLLLTSETGGEYVVPVSGRCVAPKPRGPIAVSASGGASVAFKNPFDAETTFACVTDNPAFIVTRSETIGAKQTKQINVRFEPQESGNTVQATRTAKLLVSSDRCPGAPWAFYLKAAD